MPKFSEADYQARSDMDTLIEAAKIKRDKKRMEAANKKLKEQRKALKDVIGEKE